MKIIWKIYQKDIDDIKLFLKSQENNDFVKERIIRNLASTKPKISKSVFWKRHVACLLTTQQKSGPGGPVDSFLKSNPFILNYNKCCEQDELQYDAEKCLSSAGGLRFARNISEYIANNHDAMEHLFWARVSPMLDELRGQHDPAYERKVAHYIAKHLKGYGPKQSRNLLQWLGLTQYEIPLDSRIINWFNNWHFPVVLSAKALSDPHYYEFILEGIQQLCARCDVFPCVLDAAIFSSVDESKKLPKALPS
ncbi:hypothetical protein ACFL34_00595 [Candidatus Sumerlaeota bacterium]